MKNSFFFFIAIYCIACGNSNEKEGDARFWDLNIDELVSDSIQSMPINKSTLIIDEMESFIGKKVDLNNVIDKVQFIALKFIEGRFLGNIDKIQFDDRYIFILDIYHTKSLNVFDFETGNQIAFIESGDVSPYAPYTIDDFDYDSESNVVYLYDQNQSRIMTYSPTGELIHNKRVSLGFQNFSFSNNRFIFYAVLDKNVHLGQSLSGSNILISNPSFQIIANG